MTYEPSPDESPSTAVITAVADVTGCSQLDLEPLATTIDADALDRLLGSTDADSPVAVTFEYAGYEITVTPCEVRLRSRE